MRSLRAPFLASTEWKPGSMACCLLAGHSTSRDHAATDFIWPTTELTHGRGSVSGTTSSRAATVAAARDAALQQVPACTQAGLR